MHFHTLFDALFSVWPALADAAIKTAVVLLAASLAALTMSRAPAARRHFFWALILISALGVPVLSALMPAWRIDVAAQAAARHAMPLTASPANIDAEPRGLSIAATHMDKSTAAPTSAVATAGSAQVASRDSAEGDRPDPLQHLFSYIVAIWLVGVATMLVPVMLGLLSVWRLGRRSSPLTDASWRKLVEDISRQIGVGRHVTLLRSNERVMPMTWGILKPMLLIPADADEWPVQRRRVVIFHELTHIRRCDCLTQILAHVARALYWFNPLAWWAAYRLGVERELACDDAVLHRGTLASDYAEQLLGLATGRDTRGFPVTALAMARPSRLRDRVTAILDPARRREMLGRTEAAILTAICALLVIPMSIMKPVATVAANVAEAPAVAVADIPPLPADTTVLVRLDLTQCTPDSLAATAKVELGDSARELDQPIAMIKPYFDALTGHHSTVVWFSESAQADHPGPVGPTFYAEAPAEADATAISNDLPKITGMKDLTFARDGKFLVIRQGSAAPMAGDEKMRQAFAASLKAAGPAQGIMVAMVSNAAMRDSLSRGQKGEPPIAVLISQVVSGSQSITIAATPGPSPKVVARFNCDGRQAATNIAAKLTQAIAAMRDEMTAAARHEKDDASVPGREAAVRLDVFNAMLQGLTPTINDNVVEISMEEKAMAKAGGVMSLILSARHDSKLAFSANKMRQLSIGLLMYCSAHDGNWPDKLQDISDLVGGDETFKMLIANPVNGQSPGYVYEKPAAKLGDLKDPATVAVLHEGGNGKKDPDGFVAYADGHVARESK